MKDLDKYIVKEAAHKWKDLGLQLLPYGGCAVLHMIEVDHPCDTVSCCRRVLEEWLDTTTDATWNQLTRALKNPRVQLDYLADRLEQMMVDKRELCN